MSKLSTPVLVYIAILLLVLGGIIHSLTLSAIDVHQRLSPQAALNAHSKVDPHEGTMLYMDVYVLFQAVDQGHLDISVIFDGTDTHAQRLDRVRRVYVFDNGRRESLLNVIFENIINDLEHRDTMSYEELVTTFYWANLLAKNISSNATDDDINLEANNLKNVPGGKDGYQVIFEALMLFDYLADS